MYLQEFDFFLAKGEIREFKAGLIVPKEQTPAFFQFSEEDVSAIPLNSEFSKQLTLVSSPPMAAFVLPGQNTPCLKITHENEFFDEQIKVDETLFDFSCRNYQYLFERNISAVHELQDYFRNKCVWYSVIEIKKD